MSFSAFCRPVEGCADEGQNVDGFPVYCGFKDITGKVKVPVVNADGSFNFAAVAGTTVTANQGTANAGGANAWPVRLGDGTQFLDVVSFANVNSTLSPTITSVERVSSDINVQDASTSTTNRVRSAKDITPGVGGGAMLGVGVGVYDSAGGLFRAMLGDGSGRLIVGGAAASGATAAGNPVLIAGLSGAGNATTLGVAPANSDGITAANNGLTTTTRQYDYNALSWDGHRNNVDVTLLASASRNTTQTSADITTFNCKGITVIVDCTAGTGTVTLTINGKDPASGKYYPLLTGTAVTATTTNVYRIQEALAAVANKDVGAVLPRVIQIVLTSNLTALTFSVGYTLHN